jgi:hypothetical protein
LRVGNGAFFCSLKYISSAFRFCAGGLFFLPSGRLVRRLFSFHFPVAGWLREFNKNPKKEPHMANRNTNPGIGKNADSGVMHNPISQGFAQDLVSREGQRPRCPCGGESGSGDAAPPGTAAKRPMTKTKTPHEDFKTPHVRKAWAA